MTSAAGITPEHGRSSAHPWQPAEQSGGCGCASFRQDSGQPRLPLLVFLFVPLGSPGQADMSQVQGPVPDEVTSFTWLKKLPHSLGWVPPASAAASPCASPVFLPKAKDYKPEQGCLGWDSPGR